VEDAEALIETVFAEYRPNVVAALGDKGDVIPLLKDRPRLNDKATAYVCRRFVCKTPVTEPQALAEQLNKRSDV
ncbi:MAG TPA: N-acylglucosamine 2-epimerase, partial [Anaerolineae bacterium]